MPDLPPLVLASASPRRAELLRQLTLDFTVAPSDASELHDPTLTACELARVNAFRKAYAVASRFPQSLVLGADTLVFLEQRLFGKPRDLAEAREMLGQLRDQTHSVVTGVCLFQWQTNRRTVFAEITDVRFKPLNAEVIERYVRSVNPLDKAGGYAIQECGDALVAGIRGSYSNVVGLPLERLAAELSAWRGG